MFDTNVFYLKYFLFEITIDWFDWLVLEIYSILQGVYSADTEVAGQTQTHYRASASLRQYDHACNTNISTQHLARVPMYCINSSKHS